MKPPNPQAHTELSPDAIGSALAEAGLDSTNEQQRLLALHAAEVLEANERFNLTRITDPLKFLTLHIVDSALALPFLASAPPGALVDLGSGGGYPGVVLGVLSLRPTVLLESVQKKARFLEGLCAQLSIDMAVLPVRAEDAGTLQRGAFAVVVARAVAPLPALVELASPLLAIGGRLVAMKARPLEEEIERGAMAGALCGLAERESVEIRLGREHLRRIITYEKVGEASIDLPRRTGLAQHQPLA